MAKYKNPVLPIWENATLDLCGWHAERPPHLTVTENEPFPQLMGLIESHDLVYWWKASCTCFPWATFWEQLYDSTQWSNRRKIKMKRMVEIWSFGIRSVSPFQILKKPVNEWAAALFASDTHWHTWHCAQSVTWSEKVRLLSGIKPRVLTITQTCSLLSLNMILTPLIISLIQKQHMKKKLAHIYETCTKL